MKLILSIVLLPTFISLSIALKAQMLNKIESNILNEHFESSRGDFNFTDKKVGFFYATKVWNKEDFFKQLIEINELNQSMSNQFLILNKNEKETSGYDVFIYSWSHFRISRKQIGSHIKKIKKRSTKKP